MSVPRLSSFTHLPNNINKPTSKKVQINNSEPARIVNNLENMITDPKLETQKKIIEALFLKEEIKDTSLKPNKKDQDTIVISSEALALYEELSLGVTYEKNGEKLEIQYQQTSYVEVGQLSSPVREAEPLIMDLNGNGIELSDVRKGEGVIFDITGDQQKEQVSWVAPQDGLLVLDRNKNGTIDSGKELFGDQHGAKNGFAELTKFDSDQDGRITPSDYSFNELKIWQDYNQNGKSELSELKSLRAYAIKAIDLIPDNTRHYVAGNRIEGYSHYHTAEDREKIAEVYLNYRG